MFYNSQIHPLLFAHHVYFFWHHSQAHCMYHHIHNFLQFIKYKNFYFILGCPEYFFRFGFISLKVHNLNLNSFTFNLNLKLKLKSAYHAFRSSELLVIFEFPSHTPQYTVLCRNLSAPCLIHFHSSNLAYTVFSLFYYCLSPHNIYLSYPKLPFLFSFLPSLFTYVRIYLFIYGLIYLFPSVFLTNLFFLLSFFY